MGFVTRRRFLQGSAAAGGAALGHRFLFGGSETLIPAAYEAEAPLHEDFVPSTCWIGKQECGIVARRVDGRVIKLEGHPDNPRNLGTLCPKGQAQIAMLYDPNRVKVPLVRTNEKGKAGTWRQASWAEALTLVADNVKEAQAKDPSAVLWQKGRSKSETMYDDALINATKWSKLGHGAYCSDAGYRAAEYITGLHGVMHPDMRNVKYLLSWGWNITNAGGNKYCWITWNRELLAAKAGGTKVVHLDPRARSAGPHADTWLPIRPATDLAFALALCNVLIENGFLDQPYLKRYTNAAFLVLEDGTVLRRDETELVMDADGSAKPLADATDPVLEGSFEVDGQAVRPAFEVLKEHVAQYTPEWAAKLCGLDADQIRQVGLDFGKEARIGSTVVVDGVEIPYRPVGIMAYHMCQQELGFDAIRAMLTATMLVGAVGAVGGQGVDFKWKIHENYEKLGKPKVGDAPYHFTLKDSKYYPINSKNPGILATVMADPDKYGVEKVPEVAIIHMANPVVSFADSPAIKKAYAKFKFVAVISPWISETADQYADVILPAATMEKYEGVSSADDQYTTGKSLRLPVMDPLGESKGEVDIYLDLTEAIDKLYGEGGYLHEMNIALELEGTEFALPLDTKPTPRDIFDRWSKMEELEGGIEYFEKNGVWVKGPRKPGEMFGYVADPPFGGALHRLYGESLLETQKKMKEKGADEIYWRPYTALPTWRTPTMYDSPNEYNLTLISYKLIENKQSRSSFNPLLSELAPHQRLDINPETAKQRGIGDGDLVVVESHNAVTGETRKVKVPAAYTDGIRPDVVGMPHHFGLWTHPAAEDQGPSANTLYFTAEGYVTQTADQSFHVRVRVYPAGGEG